MERRSKNITILFFICAGMFLLPVIGFACSGKAEKPAVLSCSAKETAQTHKKDCSAIPSHKKNKHHNTCNDSCKHSSCRCSTSSGSASLLMPAELKAAYPFYLAEKQLFGYKQPHYTTGYYSILQPPKIS